MTKNVDYFVLSELSVEDQALFAELAANSQWQAVIIQEEVTPVLLKDCYEHFQNWKANKARMEKCNPYIQIPMDPIILFKQEPPYPIPTDYQKEQKA